MINEIKDVQTTYNLNPQRFSNLKCKQHPDQIVNWVGLENDRETKLFCNVCLSKEKDLDPNSTENFKKQLIDYKTFLKNLYTYSTLDENDPERFSSEIVQCLDGAKQPEKLKLFMVSVSQTKNELKKEFSKDFNQKIEEFQKEIIQQIEKIKQNFVGFFEEQIDLLFSRETLAIKQFKDRGCKMILSAAKSAGACTSVAEEITAFDNLSQAISRIHSGKVEISYAKEHSLRILKSLLSDFEKKIIFEGSELMQKNASKHIPEIQQQHIFMPWKKQNQPTRQINFSYLHHSNTQNDINKMKRESFSSISEVAKTDSKRSINVQNVQGVHTQNNSIDSTLRKSTSNSTFIIKPVPQVNSNSRRESYITPKMKKISDDNITLKVNLKSEIMNSLIECNSPKSGYLVNNYQIQKTDNAKSPQISQFQQNSQQANLQQYAVFNSQKQQNIQQENVFKDTNYLSIPNGTKESNFLQIPTSNTKQPSGTSLFSSFSSTLRTKSSTNINLSNLPVPSDVPLQQITPTNQAPPSDKFSRKLNFQKNYTVLAASTDNLQYFQPQNQIQTDQSDQIDKDQGKYYIGQSNNENKQHLQRNRSPKSGVYLCPFPNQQKPIGSSNGLNTSEKNLSFNNNSQSQTKDNQEYELENGYYPQNQQPNKSTVYQNQMKNVSTSSSSQSTQQSISLASQSSGSKGSRMKNNIIKNVLINNTTKQISTDNLKHSKEIIQEKPFKYNLLQIIRIPFQANVGQNFHDQGHSSSNLPAPRARRISPDLPGENGKRSNSNSPPRDSKDNNQNSNSGIGSSSKLEESSNFLLAQPDGYVSLYNVQGRNINQIFRERTHTKLNSIAIGKTGQMFFTAGEQNKTSSIKLWIFHSHQRFSELVELKMADSNIKKIFFVKEEYASRLNKLSFAIWTQTTVEPTKTEISKSSSTLQSQQQQLHTINKVGLWNLEFAGNKFEGAKMFNVSSVELPINTLNVQLKEDEVLAYTKDTLSLYVMMNEYSSIHKKSHQKFINVIKKDTLCCVRSYQQSKLTQRNYFAFSESGYVVILNDQLNIIQEKSVRDLTSKPITLEDAILYEPDCDFLENSRFLHFFKKENCTLYVFDLENLRVVDELQSFDEIKNIFFFGSGFYLGFEQFFVRIWKPLPQKQEIISSMTIYDEK